MNISLYEYTALFLIPYIIFHFTVDFLSDKEITSNETIIGTLQLFHHIVCAIYMFGIILMPFVTRKLSILFITIVTSLVIQVGYLINNDYCWLTKLVNQMINPEKIKRKWTGGDIVSIIKRYIRGDSWTYGNIEYIDNTTLVLIVNVVHIVCLIIHCKYRESR